MICRNCGSEVREGAVFCPKCGAKIIPDAEAGSDVDVSADNGAETQQPVPPEDSIPPYEEPPVPEAPKEKKRRRVWIPIVIIVAVVVVAFFLLEYFGVLPGSMGARDQTVDLDAYVSLEFDGYDESGTAEVRFDADALGEDYDDLIRLTGEAKDQGYDSFSDLVSEIAAVTVSPDSGLSIGDEVTVAWEIDASDFDGMIRNQLEIVCEPETFTVSGLTEIQTFDAFAGITVEFSGIAPYASAEILRDDSAEEIPEAADYLTFTLSPDENLSIGDTVTVTIEASGADALKSDLGMYPEEMTREYTVEDISCYVSSLDQIPEEDMEKMIQQAEDIVEADFADWGDGEQLLSMDYLGAYFLCAKQEADVYDTNMIYQVFKVNARDVATDKDDKEVTSDFSYYWFCGYFDGMLLADGTYSMDFEDYEECANVFFRDGYDEEEETWTVEDYYYYYGYEDPDSMYDDLVNAVIDDYVCESTVQE